MKITVSFLLFAVFLSGCNNDPTVPVDVQVVNELGNPVDGASVTAYSNYSLGTRTNDKWAGIKGAIEATATTNKEGRAIMQILPGQYAFQAIKNGLAGGGEKLVISGKNQVHVTITEKISRDGRGADLSKLKCEIDPESGKTKSCVCIVDEAKNKFTVIIQKGSIFDAAVLQSKIRLFLNSVEHDLQIDSIGISYFEGDSIPELESFIDELFYEKNVGYVMYIGDQPNLFEIVKGPLEALDYDLALVDKEWNLPANETGEREINLDAYCREIAISWLFPQPASSNNAEKVSFIEKAIDTYTRYHNNEERVLDAYSKDHLYIDWVNGKPLLGSDLPEPPYDYGLPVVKVFNSEYSQVASELKNKHYLWTWNVHGNINSISFGLNPDNQVSEFDAVYTSKEEFEKFFSDGVTPAILASPGSCGFFAVNNDPSCCWQPRFMNTGIWSIFATSPGRGITEAEVANKLSTAPFLGHAIRNNPLGQYIIFGDITAHFPE